MSLKKNVFTRIAGQFLRMIGTFFTGFSAMDNPHDSAMAAWLRARREKDDAEVAETVRAFIASHPHLSLSAFGIPTERYEAAAPFMATNAVAMLLRRHPHDDVDALLLSEDGRITMPDGCEWLPASVTVKEITVSLMDTYIPRLEELTNDYAAAIRAENERLATTAVFDAQAFLQWMHAALQTEPKLLRGFVASPASEKRLLLRPDPSASKDPLTAWQRTTTAT